MGWEATLAGLVADPPATLFPEAALDAAALAVTDLIGVTLAGVKEPVTGVVADYYASAGITGKSTVIGQPYRLPPADAAFANAVVGHTLDYDDSNLTLGGHPSVVVFPALLALGELTGASGVDILRAYVTGFEVIVRLARGVNFAHYEKGWHPTATIGVFGAAAAAAQLLGLDRDRAGAALALAATMSSGVKASFGTMAKPFQVGRAAQAGVVAARMAAAGMTTPADMLSARQGFFNVYNGAGSYLAEPPQDDGQPEILKSGLSFKNYPCCGSTHVVIDTASDLKAATGLTADRIAAVEVLMNPRRIPHVDRPVVTDALGGKFSVQYTVAAALTDGSVGLDHFTPAAIRRADLQALTAKVRLAGITGETAALGQPCRVNVTTTDGRVHTATLDGPRGREPASYREVARRKFLDCAGRTVPPDHAARLFAQLRDLRNLTDIRRLTESLAAPFPASAAVSVAETEKA